MLLLPSDLPKECTQYTFTHPRTKRAAKYIIAGSNLLELRQISTERTMILGTKLHSADAVVGIYTNPLFLILPVLFDHRQKIMPLQFLLDIASQENDSIPLTLVERHCESICTFERLEDELCVRLDEKKMLKFIENQIEKMSTAIPSILEKDVLKKVTPVDPSLSPSPELVTMVKQYCAVSLITATYLPVELSDFITKKYDFTLLHTTISQISLQRQSIEFPTNISNDSGTTVSNDSSLRMKKSKPRGRKMPVVEDNSSILDMFKKK